MKKAIVICLAILWAFALASCSQAANVPAARPTETVTVQPTPTITPTPSPSTPVATPAPTAAQEIQDKVYRLTLDTAEYEEITPDSEYMLEGLLYVRLQTFPKVSDDAYDEQSMAERIEALEDSKIAGITLALSDEYSAQLTYPAWRIIYETGANEDAKRCEDIYFQTDTNEYRVHTSAPVDAAEGYRDDLKDYDQRIAKLFASIRLVEEPGPGDPGDTGLNQWWGEYKSDDLGFAIEITELTGDGFYADITLLRNGNTVLAGTAAISAEDERHAIMDGVEFRLYKDFSAIDIQTSEGSQWAHIRGRYERVE